MHCTESVHVELGLILYELRAQRKLTELAMAIYVRDLEYITVQQVGS